VRRDEPGPLRRRLARRLLEIGIVVDPSSFRAAVGYWRTDHRADCYRWEAWATIEGDPMPRPIGSYDTMTECAKHGLCEEYDLIYTSIEVHARAKDPRPDSV
jgi:hypothetical protein